MSCVHHRRTMVARGRYNKLQGFRVRAIRRLYATGKFSMADLGVAFDVTRQRIEQIVNKACK